MIDKKTRDKILKLWREGNSKAEIQRKTRVSLPSIRRILSESDLDEINNIIKSEESRVVHLMEFEKRLSALEETVENLEDWRKKLQNPNDHIQHKFILNFTRQFPLAKCRDYWEALTNGISPRLYKEILSKLFDYDVVEAINEKIRVYSPLQGKVFSVLIDQNRTNAVDVRLIHSAF